jgi:ATP/maltotriose-dependent transcriptional regulator MalT
MRERPSRPTTPSSRARDSQRTARVLIVARVALDEEGLAALVEREPAIESAVVLSELATAPEPSWRVTLTPRELQVAGLIDEGLSNSEIASHLYIELSTVKNHVHNILQKLRLSRRGQVTAMMHRR